jgi:putative transposase
MSKSVTNLRVADQAQDILIENGLEKASDMFEQWYSSLYNYLAFNKNNHKRLRTTNVIERVNSEIKRRTKKIGAFPNDNALMRLTVSIMMDINEEWITGRKYLSMEVEYGLYRIFSKLQQFMYTIRN